VSAFRVEGVNFDLKSMNDRRSSAVNCRSHSSQFMQSTPPSISPEPPESNSPPQFGLRGVFLVVTVVCVLLAVLRLVSALVLGILVLLVLTVGAHLAASGMARRLHGQAARKTRRKTRGAPLGDASPVDPLRDANFAPTTRLSQHHPMGRIAVIAPILGGIVGTSLGGLGMASFLGSKATLANVAVAAVAAGVLGAIGSFLLATFLKTLLQANVEAWRHEESGGLKSVEREKNR